MSLQENIKQYVILDNEIKEISNHLKSLRQKKIYTMKKLLII